ncbi:MAG: MBL fold metallo-hydrolase, partial [Actinomycetota bacterium]|nr:MBL fold metallo-hydrolase [Actinomycetota bacterium]
VSAIDTCFTERRSRAFLAAIASVTDRPVRTLVNTHHHGDHTHGNWLLPEATIIGHDKCRSAVLESGLVAESLFPGVDWGEVRVAPPFVTFAERLTLHVDDLAVELDFMGPAHTTNDVVAWLPDRGVLFAGDLVFAGGTPFLLMGSVSGAVQAVERLSTLAPTTIVPGHGPVSGPEVLADQLAYLRFVQEVAAEGVRAGLSPLDAAREADLGPFAHWHDTERLVGNLHRAMAELAGAAPGADLDLVGAIGDMITYNDGRPLRCLA